ncbi:hypothetical protein PYCCODRAFT_1239570 [Trametes coccinea BRFM310]|uniref:Uncharacterized protein n=1 Tax=Trametes coccinea (strain BRFM310) TaxID=1353009 RepID=A0A1Y2IWG3_TRAC3|nr:hypothetical protein PYCCODRAFT_1239570 [Trametes coccinea BRFM310]
MQSRPHAANAAVPVVARLPPCLPEALLVLSLCFQSHCGKCKRPWRWLCLRRETLLLLVSPAPSQIVLLRASKEPRVPARPARGHMSVQILFNLQGCAMTVVSLDCLSAASSLLYAPIGPKNRFGRSCLLETS